MNNVVGSCSITRLRNGDTVSVTLAVVQGSTCVFYGDSGYITQFAQNNVQILPQVVSARGAVVQVKESTWTLGANTQSVVERYPTSFAVDPNTGMLTIKGNDFLPNLNSVYNPVLTWHGTVIVGSYEQSLQKSVELTMVKEGASPYFGQIQLKDALQSTILSAENVSCTFKQVLLKSGEQVPASDYSVKWYINDSDTPATTSEFTVNRDQVNGAAHVRCEFYVGKDIVEADGVTVIDSADEMRIELNNEYQVEYNGTANITPKLYDVTNQAYISPTDWSLVVRNNYTEAVIPVADYTFNESTGAFSMQESKMYYTPEGTSTRAEYNPILIFTANL